VIKAIPDDLVAAEESFRINREAFPTSGAGLNYGVNNVHLSESDDSSPGPASPASLSLLKRPKPAASTEEKYLKS